MNNVRISFVTLLLVAASQACAPAPAPTPVPTTTPPPSATRVLPTNTAIPATATIAPTAIPPTPTTAPTATATATATVKPIAIKVVQNATLGKILTDGDGRTLYLLTADKQGVSVCNDDCVKSWPPLISPSKAAAQEGANASLIGTNQRKDGSVQATYNGWPLYYRSTDVKPGDTTGQGLDGVWFVVTPEGNGLTPPDRVPATDGYK